MTRSFAENVRRTYAHLKATQSQEDVEARAVPLESAGSLVPFGHFHLRDTSLVEKIAHWREVNMHVFPTQFRVTVESTEIWLRDNIVSGQDRILFLIRPPDRRIVGHIGFMEVSDTERSLRFAYLMSGDDPPPGLITAAMWGVLQWAATAVAPDYVWGPPFADNQPPINILAKLGFRDDRLVPLRKTTSPGRVDYLPMPDDDPELPDRFWRRMIWIPGTSKFDSTATPAPIDLEDAKRNWNKRSR